MAADEQAWTASSLRSSLAAERSVARAIVLAAGFWRKASDSSSSSAEVCTTILDAVASDLKDRCSDDLFSSATDDVAGGLLELLGFALAAPPPSRGRDHRRPALRTAVAPQTVPTEFLRRVLRQIGTREAVACIALLLSPLKSIRLDRLLRDTLDAPVLAALKDKKDKNVAMVLGLALETEARESRTLDFPGPFERGSCLAPLLGATPIVPFGALPHNSFALPPCEARQYFSALANFPYVTRPDLELQLGMVRAQLSDIQALAKGLIERALKQAAHREGVLAWFARAIELNYRHLQGSGHAGIFDDDMTGRAPQDKDKCCSSGFILNLATILLQLLKPICDDAQKFLPKVEIEYVKVDWRINFSSHGKLKEGGALSTSSDAPTTDEPMEGNGAEEQEMEGTDKGNDGGGGGGGGGGGADEDDDEDDDDDDEAAMLAAAMAMSMKPHADPSFFPVDEVSGESTNRFSFVTEIFWLASRAMELVHKMVERRREHDRSVMEYARQARAAGGAQGGGRSPAERAADVSVMTLRFGWDAQLYDPAFVTRACGWAEFSSRWVRTQLSAFDSPQRFACLPAGLVKAMCDVWTNAAYMAQTNPDVMPGLMAADAAVFCTELMARPDLVSSPIVQDQCLNVLDAFLRTGGNFNAVKAPTSPNGSHSQQHGSPYFGNHRGLAGAVMDNQRIREELAPALMRLYSECHAVAGLDVDEDVGFDKFSIRHRSNALLTFLWHHPIGEPRKSILDLVGDTDGALSLSSVSSSTAALSPFDGFLEAAYDTVMYNLDDALRRIRDGRRDEQSAGARATVSSSLSSSSSSSSSYSSSFAPKEPPAHSKEGRFYARQQRSARSFIARSDSTFNLLNTFCESNVAIRRRVAGFSASQGGIGNGGAFMSPAIGRRTAQVLYTCLHEQCSEDTEDGLAVIDPEKWGFNREEHLRMPATLLATILDPATLSEEERTVFVESLREHADYESSIWRRAAAVAGGECLMPHVDILEGGGCGGVNAAFGASLLSHHGMELTSENKQAAEKDRAIDWGAWIAEFEAAEVAAPQYDEDAYNAAYNEAFADAEQVASIDDDGGFEIGGAAHFFQIGGSGHAVTIKSGGEASGRAIKAIAKDYRKLSRLLPPPHPNAAIAVRYDGERVSFCRAVVTGRADTPYFGGVFVFDILFPKEYPNVPPIVQLVTTGHGTVRFNPNLYQDGKVCLSVLGTWHGDSSEKWNPSTSSLYQVLVSIQTQILVAEPYFNEPGLEGQRGTAEGQLRSEEENEKLRLDTIRHAIVGVLRSHRRKGVVSSSASASSCLSSSSSSSSFASPSSSSSSGNSVWPELRPIFVAHFGHIRLRLFTELRTRLRELEARGPTKAPAAARLRRAIRECKEEIDRLLSPESSLPTPPDSMETETSLPAPPQSAAAVEDEPPLAVRSPNGQAEAKRARSESDSSNSIV